MDEQQKVIIEHRGGEIFRLVFPKNNISVLKTWIDVGTHDLQLVTDKSVKHVIGVEGERKVLLSWLRELPISKEALQSYEKILEES